MVFWSGGGEWCAGKENDGNHFLVWELIDAVEIFMERSVVELGGAESVWRGGRHGTVLVERWEGSWRFQSS